MEKVSSKDKERGSKGLMLFKIVKVLLYIKYIKSRKYVVFSSVGVNFLKPLQQIKTCKMENRCIFQ